MAESHVYTSIKEHNNIMQYDRFLELTYCPKNYVRLVYCLGYGENDFVNIEKNPGTWQFWEIFCACLNQNSLSEKKKILKGKTKSFDQRIQNKIHVLKKLQEKGIWLVDASILALYDNGKKPSPKIMTKILQISWKHHISKLIQETNPKKIIVIGKEVSNKIEDELKTTRIPIYTQSQPQDRLSQNKREENLAKYFELCNIDN